jgi:hypothetical protein
VAIDGLINDACHPELVDVEHGWVSIVEDHRVAQAMVWRTEESLPPLEAGKEHLHRCPEEHMSNDQDHSSVPALQHNVMYPAAGQAVDCCQCTHIVHTHFDTAAEQIGLPLCWSKCCQSSP